MSRVVSEGDPLSVVEAGVVQLFAKVCHKPSATHILRL